MARIEAIEAWLASPRGRDVLVREEARHFKSKTQRLRTLDGRRP